MSTEYNGTGVSPETFNKIINDRKADVKQKREEKRLHDLRRIQEMRSREGFHPVEIFPKEIWQQILHQLNPEDHGNVWKIHDMFRNIMENSHVRDNLFPQILKYEVKNFWPDNELYSPLATNLDLRQVSKSLKKSVDHFLETDLVKNVQKKDIDYAPRKTISFPFYGDFISRDLDRLDLILNRLTQSNSKFMVTKSLNVQFDTHLVTKNTFEQFKEKITLLLQNCGEYIWYFSFHALNFAEEEASVNCKWTQIYLVLIEWLSLMENLKWFSLKLYCNETCTNHVVPKVLQCQPPPKLGNLKRVEFLMNSLPRCQSSKEAIFRAILDANPHVTDLYLSGRYNILSSANSCHLETVGLGSEDFRCPLLRIRNSLNSHYCNLKKMSLCIRLKTDESIAALFLFFQKFPLLENLKLDLRNVTIGHGIDFLQLPKLTDLSLSINPKVIVYSAPIHFFFSLQFLLYLKNLKTLDWNYNSSKDRELKTYLERKDPIENLIDFNGGFGVLTRSSKFWKVFPNLELVNVSVKYFVEDVGRVHKWKEYRNRELRESGTHII